MTQALGRQPPGGSRRRFAARSHAPPPCRRVLAGRPRSRSVAPCVPDAAPRGRCARPAGSVRSSSRAHCSSTSRPSLRLRARRGPRMAVARRRRPARARATVRRGAAAAQASADARCSHARPPRSVQLVRVRAELGGRDAGRTRAPASVAAGARRRPAAPRPLADSRLCGARRPPVDRRQRPRDVRAGRPDAGRPRVRLVGAPAGPRDCPSVDRPRGPRIDRRIVAASRTQGVDWHERPREGDADQHRHRRRVQRPVQPGGVHDQPGDNYAPAASPGSSAPLLQFVHGNVQTLEMELATLECASAGVVDLAATAARR